MQSWIGMPYHGLIAVKNRRVIFPVEGSAHAVEGGRYPGRAAISFGEAGTACRDPRWAAQIVDCFAVIEY